MKPFIKKKLNNILKIKKKIECTLASLYNVVWGKCRKLLQNKLKSTPTFVKMDDNCDVATLLNEIKILSNKMEDNISTYNRLHEAKVKLFCYQQSDDEMLADYMRNFKDLCNSI